MNIPLPPYDAILQSSQSQLKTIAQKKEDYKQPNQFLNFYLSIQLLYCLPHKITPLFIFYSILSVLSLSLFQDDSFQ